MHVAGLAFTPLKGARQDAVAGAFLSEHGIEGDRRFGLLDGVRILRTVGHPQVLRLGFAVDDGEAVLTLPDGRRIAQRLQPAASIVGEYWGRRVPLQTLPGAISGAASAFLGREITLARVIEGRGLIYGAAVSIGFATRLGQVAPEASDWGRFRFNMLVDDAADRADEPELVGRLLTVGEATLRVQQQLERCTVIDHDPASGRRDRALFASLPAPDGRRTMGVAASVLAAGIVRVGDELRWG